MKCAHKLNYGKECHPTNCPVFTLKASDSLRKRCSQIREETWQPKSSKESNETVKNPWPEIAKAELPGLKKALDDALSNSKE